MKIINLLLLFALPLAAGCGNETTDNGNISDPEISERTQVEKEAEEQ